MKGEALTKLSVGFDSLLFSRREIETPDKVFKALMAVAVTTKNKDSFRKEYDDALLETFREVDMNRKKVVYKSYHFCMQTKDPASELICSLLEKLSDVITRIDVYCAFYDLPDISIFGDASGQTIKRMTFLERNQHGFHHVCAWQYFQDFGNNFTFELDHFEGRKTPAWEALIDNDLDINVYYSGCECNALISIADLILKLIQIHQHGHLSTSTLFRPIQKNCPSLKGYGRLNYHAMKRHLRMTTPTVPYFIDLKPFIKHPIFFLVWNPDAPREKVKPMFEWSPIYNAVVKKAYEKKGCLKFFSTEDHLLWNPETDNLVAWSDVDEEVIEWIKNMGYNLPKVLKKEDILA